LLSEFGEDDARFEREPVELRARIAAVGDSNSAVTDGCVEPGVGEDLDEGVGVVGVFRSADHGRGLLAAKCLHRALEDELASFEDNEPITDMLEFSEEVA
jgi:hypothetical protein